MKTTQFIAATMVSIALAACQQKTADEQVADATNAQINADTLMPAGNIIVAVDQDAASPTPPSNAATPAKLPTHIPSQFHGRWGINRADCTSSKGDAKGLLTINDARLAFYESKGTLDKVLGATANSIDANYGFSGEGQTWERVERLKLVGGKLQRRTDAKVGQEPPVNLTYSRC